MAEPGQVLYSPITGEEITFIRTASQTGGETLEFRSRQPPSVRGLPPHFHPRQTEELEVVQGEIAVLYGKETRILKAGERIVIPPNTVHTWANLGDEEAHVITRMTPALNFERILATGFALAGSKRVKANGTPTLGALLEMAAVLRAHPGEYYLATPSIRAQRIFFGFLGLIGQILGYGRRGGA